MNEADDLRAEVLAANEAFYRAFAHGDFAVMERLWADDARAACVHPGWPPVRGRDKVIMSWDGILANPPQPPIRVMEAEATVVGNVAWVICFEAIGEIYLVATNLFVREDGVWKMIHHQSGQTERRPRGGSPPEPHTVH